MSESLFEVMALGPALHSVPRRGGSEAWPVLTSWKLRSMSSRPSVFVARASAEEDAEVLLSVYAVLERRPTWTVIEVPIHPDWWDEAEPQIARCDLFLYVDTPATRRSEHCDREFAAALRHARTIVTIEPHRLDELDEILDGAEATFNS